MKTAFLKFWLGESTNTGNLSPNLTHALEGLTEDSLPPNILPATFTRVVSRLSESLLMYDQVYENPYHNRDHSLAVADRVRTMMRRTSYSEVVQQAVFLAALGHDLGHPGARTRDKALKALMLPELGVDVTNEYVSGVLVDKILEDHGIDVQVRVLVFVLIQATSFDHHVQRKTELERLIALADVVTSKMFCEWVIESANVLREKPRSDRPSSIDDWLVERCSFLTYIRQRLVPFGVNTHTAMFGEISRTLLAIRRGYDPLGRLLVETIIGPLLPGEVSA